MSSNGRITCSKGPADGVSLPPITRPKKGTNAEAETEKSMATQHQTDGQGHQLGNTVEQTSPLLDQVPGQVPAQHPPTQQRCPWHLTAHLCSQAARPGQPS